MILGVETIPAEAIGGEGWREKDGGNRSCYRRHENERVRGPDTRDHICCKLGNGDQVGLRVPYLNTWRSG